MSAEFEATLKYLSEVREVVNKSTVPSLLEHSSADIAAARSNYTQRQQTLRQTLQDLTARARAAEEAARRKRPAEEHRRQVDEAVRRTAVATDSAAAASKRYQELVEDARAMAQRRQQLEDRVNELCSARNELLSLRTPVVATNAAPVYTDIDTAAGEQEQQEQHDAPM
eukprot:m51a1_g7726 hypothetical protein (169) ;mRNA; r:153807-154702